MKTCKRVAVGVITQAGLMCVASGARGITKDINAEFRPDPTKPHNNTFENTTPLEGYCARYLPSCELLKIFSLQVPFKFQSVAPIQANHADQRQGAMFKVPGNWRKISVTGAQTGRTEELEVRIAAVGVLWRTTTKVQELVGRDDDNWGVAHRQLWSDGGSWIYPPSPCGYTGSADWGEFHFAAFWLTPDESVCAKQASFQIPEFEYSYLDFAYQLRTPNPLGMAADTYVGDITYTVGPGQDFDMGDIMQPAGADRTITLNFNLDVKHVLKVYLPAGGENVELVPEGGWQRWLQNGRKPSRLFRDQTFVIASSSPFNMQMECSVSVGDTCGLKNAENHQVPLDIAVTLPTDITDPHGRNVVRQPLLLSGAGTELFRPFLYVDRKPGTLHFAVPKEAVEPMLERGGSTYSGTVTVIWDSEV